MKKKTIFKMFCKLFDYSIQNSWLLLQKSLKFSTRLGSEGLTRGIKLGQLFVKSQWGMLSTAVPVPADVPCQLLYLEVHRKNVNSVQHYLYCFLGVCIRSL